MKIVMSSVAPHRNKFSSKLFHTFWEYLKEKNVLVKLFVVRPIYLAKRALSYEIIEKPSYGLPSQSNKWPRDEEASSSGRGIFMNSWPDGYGTPIAKSNKVPRAQASRRSAAGSRLRNVYQTLSVHYTLIQSFQSDTLSLLNHSKGTEMNYCHKSIQKPSRNITRSLSREYCNGMQLTLRSNPTSVLSKPLCHVQTTGPSRALDQDPLGTRTRWCKDNKMFKIRKGWPARSQRNCHRRLTIDWFKFQLKLHILSLRGPCDFLWQPRSYQSFPSGHLYILRICKEKKN